MILLCSRTNPLKMWLLQVYLAFTVNISRYRTSEISLLQEENKSLLTEELCKFSFLRFYVYRKFSNIWHLMYLQDLCAVIHAKYNFLYLSLLLVLIWLLRLVWGRNMYCQLYNNVQFTSNRLQGRQHACLQPRHIRVCLWAWTYASL